MGNAHQASDSSQTTGMSIAAEYVAHCQQEDTAPISKFFEYLETLKSRDDVVEVVLNGNSVDTFEQRVTSSQVLEGKQEISSRVSFSLISSKC